MTDIPTIRMLLQRNNFVLHKQLEDITQADSLMQPPFRGNCMNWVLGHIVSGRNDMLKYLQAETIWDEETNDLYKRESEPILGPESPHVDYETLLADFQRAEDHLIPVLERVSEAQLRLVWEEDERKRTVGALLNSLMWHETIHVGQFEYLRQMTGVDDKVF